MRPITDRVNFQSPDWQYVKEWAEGALKQQRSLLENPDATYKEILLAKGDIKRLKTLLNLPQSASPAA